MIAPMKPNQTIVWTIRLKTRPISNLSPSNLTVRATLRIVPEKIKVATSLRSLRAADGGRCYRHDMTRKILRVSTECTHPLPQISCRPSPCCTDQVRWRRGVGGQEHRP